MSKSVKVTIATATLLALAVFSAAGTDCCKLKYVGDEFYIYQVIVEKCVIFVIKFYCRLPLYFAFWNVRCNFFQNKSTSTGEYGCKDDCVYKKIDFASNDSGIDYCFKKGNLSIFFTLFYRSCKLETSFYTSIYNNCIADFC